MCCYDNLLLTETTLSANQQSANQLIISVQGIKKPLETRGLKYNLKGD
jgi:hypothetical protein